MKRSHRNYSLEFKKKAIELSYARGSVKQICKELDIPISVLSRWRRESKDYEKNSFPGRGQSKIDRRTKRNSLIKETIKRYFRRTRNIKKDGKHLLQERQV